MGRGWESVGNDEVVRIYYILLLGCWAQQQQPHNSWNNKLVAAGVFLCFVEWSKNLSQ